MEKDDDRAALAAELAAQKESLAESQRQLEALRLEQNKIKSKEQQEAAELADGLLGDE